MKVKSGQIWASDRCDGIALIAGVESGTCVVEFEGGHYGFGPCEEIAENMEYVGDFGQDFSVPEKDTQEVCSTCLYSYPDSTPGSEEAVCCLVFDLKGLPRDHYCARYESDLD